MFQQKRQKMTNYFCLASQRQSMKFGKTGFTGSVIDDVRIAQINQLGRQELVFFLN